MLVFLACGVLSWVTGSGEIEMPYSDALLLDQIQNGPFSAEIQPLVASKRDADIAEILNLPRHPGYIPRRHLLLVLANNPDVYGLVRWISKFGTLPAELGGGAAPLALFAFAEVVQLLSGIQATEEQIRTDRLAFEFAVGQLTAPINTIVDQDFVDQVLAGEVERSQIQLVSEVEDLHISSSDVARVLGRV